jgi:aminoacrylate hydrolase
MPHAAGLYYEQHGPDDGKPLILSPGLGGSAHYWEPNLSALAARHRVIAYDHRGTGRSDRALPEPVTIDGMGKDVLGLMDALGIERAHFVGHALGGLIGLDIALSVDRIDKLVVVNGWPRIDPHTERCFEVRLDILRAAGPAAYLRAQPIFLYPAVWISEHHAELSAAERRQAADFPPIETVERRLAALRDWKLWIDFTWRDQVLIIGTADDMLVPVSASRSLADEIVSARYLEMPWGGHACNVTDPETFHAILLNFLGS